MTGLAGNSEFCNFLRSQCSLRLRLGKLNLTTTGLSSFIEIIADIFSTSAFRTMLNRYLAIDSESDKIASPTELLVVRLTEETSRKSQEHKLENSISFRLT